MKQPFADENKLQNMEHLAHKKSLKFLFYSCPKTNSPTLYSLRLTFFTDVFKNFRQKRYG